MPARAKKTADKQMCCLLLNTDGFPSANIYVNMQLSLTFDLQKDPFQSIAIVFRLI